MMQTSAVSRLSSDAITVSDSEPDVVDQAGAICFRKEADGDRFEVLLICGRTTGLWGIPKGTWNMAKTPLALPSGRRSKRLASSERR